MKDKPKGAGVLFATEAEQGILSTVLNHPSMIIEHGDTITDTLFGIESNVTIFRALAEGLEEGAVEFISIATRLRDQGKIDGLRGEIKGEKLSGAHYLSALWAHQPLSTFHFNDWIAACQDAAARRAILASCEQGMQNVRDGEAPAEIVGRLQSRLGLVTERKTRTDKTVSLIDQAEKRNAERLTGTIQLGLPTGIHPWDKALSGIFAGEMTVLGARPGVGKTAMIETAIQMQVECGRHVACFQQDMSAVMMIERMACRMAEVVYEVYATGHATSGDVARVKEALRKLRIMSKRLHIFSESKLTAPTLGAIVRRLIAQVGLSVWYLDHFQALRYDENNRTEGLTNASSFLRDLITSTDTPGILVAQLNKEAQDSRPNAGQFKYCDQLFSDADRVILLWSTDSPFDLKPNQRQEVMFTVDKNRGGGVGDERVNFHRELMTFEQL